MKIGAIKITSRFNLGNYEHIEVTVEGVLDENEKAGVATDKLLQFVEWTGNKQTRDKKALEFQNEIKSGTLSAKENEKRVKWLEQYKAKNDFIADTF